MTDLNISTALTAFVTASGKVESTATVYMGFALALVANGEDRDTVVATLIADMCKTAKVLSSKGKANPQALKSSGFAALAEAGRLLKKVAKHWDSNADVRHAVNGFLGVIPDATVYAQLLASDERYVAAGDDEAKQAKAEQRFRNNFLAVTYENRATSFSALRKALDKATKPEGTDANAEGTGEGGEGTPSVSDAAVVLKADDIAASLIARIGELSDDALVALFDAAKADMTRRTAEETPVAKAA